MGRRIALVGTLLVASGTAVLAAFVVPPPLTPVTPMDRALGLLLGLLPATASVILMTGAALLAFAVLLALTGQLPVLGHRTSLLTSGLGAWVLALVVESVLVGLTVTGPTAGIAWPGVVLLDLGFALRTGAAVLLALWVVGLLTPEGRRRADLDELRAEDELPA